MAQDSRDDLLRAPTNQDYTTITRTTATYIPQRNYDLEKGETKRYQQQFSDMYFLRLAKLKPAVEKLAEEAWDDYMIGGDTVHKVERVLDVRQGELCWVAGTVYMDMPLKPNILDDIAKDHWSAGPPPREKYVNPSGQDKVMLEDESGRLRLKGIALESELLVTGCIIAVMGTEDANGDFEVIDIKIPDLPGQPTAADLEPKAAAPDAHEDTKMKGQDTGKGKVAIISGLSITGDIGDSLALDLLMEFLLGESTSPTMQAKAAQITRLIIAGNSIGEPTPVSEHIPAASSKKGNATTKKYGYDAASYNPAPTHHLDLLLSTLLPSLPITLLPGASDPANISIPQQPLHPALFPQSRAFAAPPPALTQEQAPMRKPRRVPNTHPLHPTTNPTFFTLGGKLFLGTSGQNIDDIAKYVPSPSSDSPSATIQQSVDLLEQTLRWRIIAPTAPDTLWCYPYQSSEPFVLDDGWCPHVYFVGNQEGFGTRIVEGPEGQRVRLVAVPKFGGENGRGEVVLVDLDEDLAGEGEGVELLRFGVHDQEHKVKSEGQGKDFFAGI